MSKPMKTLYTVNTFGKLIEVQVEAQDAIWTTGSNGRFYLTQLMHETKEAAVADRLKRLQDNLKNAGTKMESIKNAIWHVERLLTPKLGELNFSADANADASTDQPTQSDVEEALIELYGWAEQLCACGDIGTFLITDVEEAKKATAIVNVLRTKTK